jgi:hypothetical protein
VETLHLAATAVCSRPLSNPVTPDSSPRSPSLLPTTRAWGTADTVAVAVGVV